MPRKLEIKLNYYNEVPTNGITFAIINIILFDFIMEGKLLHDKTSINKMVPSIHFQKKFPYNVIYLSKMLNMC